MTFNFGSLFSGIGGIDLGLERAGMHCAWQVEIDEYAQKVLHKHWPHTPRFRDIRECGKHNLSRVDLIAGGFPCQPHSLAGERQASEDERDLWPEFYRIIRELKPRWVLGENVLGLLSSEDGAFFGGILRDLAEAGYDAEWCVLRASDVGAPHQRERIFIVAHSNQFGESRQKRTGADGQCSAPLSAGVCGWADRAEMAHASECGLEISKMATLLSEEPGTSSIMADASSQRHEECYVATRNRSAGLFTGRASARPTPGLSQSRMGRVFNGLPAWLDGYRWPAGPGSEQYSWEPPRVIAERAPHQSARLKIVGNAVVPQIPEYIGYCILEREKTA